MDDFLEAMLSRAELIWTTFGIELDMTLPTSSWNILTTQQNSQLNRMIMSHLALLIRHQECGGVPTGFDPLHHLFMILPGHIDPVDLDD